MPLIDLRGAAEPASIRSARRIPATDDLAGARLGLQQRGPDNLRRRVARAIRRFAVLLGGDALAYVVVRQCVRAVSEGAVLGAPIGNVVARLVPRGKLGGFEVLAALVLGLLVTGNYGQGYERRNPGRLFLGSALAAALPLWGSAWSGGFERMLVSYAALTVVLWAALLIERVVLDHAVALVIPPERSAAQTLFVGSAADCMAALESASFEPRVGFRSVGFVDLHQPPAPGALGHISRFSTLLQRSGAETVVVCGHLPETRFHEIVDAALVAGCELLAVPRAFEVGGLEPVPLRRGGMLMIKLTTPRLRGPQYLVKRVIDVVGAGLGLVVLAPVFGVIAALVKLDSPGPVFFRQPRVGQARRFFRILKFRTMRVGADTERADLLGQNLYQDGRLFKMKEDPRVTRVGRSLRRISLDELPQLVNVLRGEMSLVGPRPPMPSEVDLYEAHHYARFDVKPGLTGPWQVVGRNDITDFEHIITLETNYIRHWSLALDFLILAKTVPAVLLRRGAH
ncbi:MAG TPA: sugar transferase [Gemmatimonadales bacterium]|nr:sugar transferase [Gemmatimonadales bacterium]